MASDSVGQPFGRSGHWFHPVVRVASAPEKLPGVKIGTGRVPGASAEGDYSMMRCFHDRLHCEVIISDRSRPSTALPHLRQPALLVRRAVLAVPEVRTASSEECDLG